MQDEENLKLSLNAAAGLPKPNLKEREEAHKSKEAKTTGMVRGGVEFDIGTPTHFEKTTVKRGFSESVMKSCNRKSYCDVKLGLQEIEMSAVENWLNDSVHSNVGNGDNLSGSFTKHQNGDHLGDEQGQWGPVKPRRLLEDVSPPQEEQLVEQEIENLESKQVTNPFDSNEDCKDDWVFDEKEMEVKAQYPFADDLDEVKNVGIEDDEFIPSSDISKMLDEDESAFLEEHALDIFPEANQHAIEESKEDRQINGGLSATPFLGHVFDRGTRKSSGAASSDCRSSKSPSQIIHTFNLGNDVEDQKSWKSDPIDYGSFATPFNRSKYTFNFENNGNESSDSPGSFFEQKSHFLGNLTAKKRHPNSRPGFTDGRVVETPPQANAVPLIDPILSSGSQKVDREPLNEVHEKSGTLNLHQEKVTNANFDNTAGTKCCINAHSEAAHSSNVESASILHPSQRSFEDFNQARIYLLENGVLFDKDINLGTLLAGGSHTQRICIKNVTSYGVILEASMTEEASDKTPNPIYSLPEGGNLYIPGNGKAFLSVKFEPSPADGKEMSSGYSACSSIAFTVRFADGKFHSESPKGHLLAQTCLVHGKIEDPDNCLSVQVDGVPIKRAEAVHGIDFKVANLGCLGKHDDKLGKRPGLLASNIRWKSIEIVNTSHCADLEFSISIGNKIMRNVNNSESTNRLFDCFKICSSSSFLSLNSKGESNPAKIKDLVSAGIFQNENTFRLGTGAHSKKRLYLVALFSPIEDMEKGCYEDLKRSPSPDDFFKCDVSIKLLQPSVEVQRLQASIKPGFIKIRVPNNLQEWNFDCLTDLSSSKSKKVPLKNCGNIMGKVCLSFKEKDGAFSVFPSSVLLQPGEIKEILVSFSGRGLASKPIEGQDCIFRKFQNTLEIHVVPKGSSYKLQFYGSIKASMHSFQSKRETKSTTVDIKDESNFELKRDGPPVSTHFLPASQLGGTETFEEFPSFSKPNNDFACLPSTSAPHPKGKAVPWTLFPTEIVVSDSELSIDKLDTTDISSMNTSMLHLQGTGASNLVFFEILNNGASAKGASFELIWPAYHVSVSPKRFFLEKNETGRVWVQFKDMQPKTAWEGKIHVLSDANEESCISLRVLPPCKEKPSHTETKNKDSSKLQIDNLVNTQSKILSSGGNSPDEITLEFSQIRLGVECTLDWEFSNPSLDECDFSLKPLGPVVNFSENVMLMEKRVFTCSSGYSINDFQNYDEEESGYHFSLCSSVNAKARKTVSFKFSPESVGQFEQPWVLRLFKKVKADTSQYGKSYDLDESLMKFNNKTSMGAVLQCKKTIILKGVCDEGVFGNIFGAKSYISTGSQRGSEEEVKDHSSLLREVHNDDSSSNSFDIFAHEVRRNSTGSNGDQKGMVQSKSYIEKADDHRVAVHDGIIDQRSLHQSIIELGNRVRQLEHPLGEVRSKVAAVNESLDPKVLISGAESSSIQREILSSTLPTVETLKAFNELAKTFTEALKVRTEGKSFTEVTTDYGEVKFMQPKAAVEKNSEQNSDNIRVHRKSESKKCLSKGVYASCSLVEFHRVNFNRKCEGDYIISKSSFDVCNGYKSQTVKCSLELHPESRFAILAESEKNDYYESRLTFVVQPMSYVTIPVVLRLPNVHREISMKGKGKGKRVKEIGAGIVPESLGPLLENDYRFNEDTGEYSDWIVLRVGPERSEKGSSGGNHVHLNESFEDIPSNDRADSDENSDNGQDKPLRCRKAPYSLTTASSGSVQKEGSARNKSRSQLDASTTSLEEYSFMDSIRVKLKAKLGYF
eukprot:Nk52_evm8s355 gene=Nk52_evmTU8s355